MVYFLCLTLRHVVTEYMMTFNSSVFGSSFAPEKCWNPTLGTICILHFVYFMMGSRSKEKLGIPPRKVFLEEIHSGRALQVAKIREPFKIGLSFK